MAVDTDRVALLAATRVACIAFRQTGLAFTGRAARTSTLARLPVRTALALASSELSTSVALMETFQDYDALRVLGRTNQTVLRDPPIHRLGLPQRREENRHESEQGNKQVSLPNHRLHKWPPSLPAGLPPLEMADAAESEIETTHIACHIRQFLGGSGLA